MDNFDSFTYNIAQFLGELGYLVEVIRNNAITVGEIADLKPDALVISPGPGRPEDTGVSLEAIARFHGSLPILGICLGHQCIGQFFGGRIAHAAEVMHGKDCFVHHDGSGVFAGIPSPIRAVRYNSLVVESSPKMLRELEISARCEKGEIMGLRHKESPTEGVQFHPDSIFTEHGRKILDNFFVSHGIRLEGAGSD